MLDLWNEAPGTGNLTMSDTTTDDEYTGIARPVMAGTDEEKLRSPEEPEIADDSEHDGLLPKERGGEKEPGPKSSFTSAFIWMVVNTLATIGIVRDHCSY